MIIRTRTPLETMAWRTLLLICTISIVVALGFQFAAAGPMTDEPQVTSKRDIETIGPMMASTHLYRPGFTIWNPTTGIASWHDKLPGPLNACDDEDECEDNAQDGCDNGCGTPGDPQPCGDGDVTNVEVSGTGCMARCANGNYYFELCGVTGIVETPDPVDQRSGGNSDAEATP